MGKQSKNFDYSKYQVKSDLQTHTLTIDETGDSFEVTVKQLSWVKRNQLVSKCLKVGGGGEQSFDGDLYIRECLKQMIVEAPWGATTEAFLLSIDERLGKALESLVPTAFGSDEGGISPDEIKKG
tara:strand:+ start:3751 stop:4125 length:375 start_codon:yes stop_codon:yes gene_type:complete